MVEWFRALDLKSNRTHKLIRIPTGGRRTSWLFTQRGERVELGTTENKSR